MRFANCMGLGGWRQKEQSIIGETAEYFRYKYWVTLGIRRGWKREQSGPCEPWPARLRQLFESWLLCVFYPSTKY